MKKLLLVGLLVFNASLAHAGIIQVGTISADATIGGINDSFQTIKNAINGQIQGSGTTGSSTNILADSIGILDMADEVNPATRDSELLTNTVDTISGGVGATQRAFVVSGCTPATDSDLTSDVSACTVYINGVRVVKTATAQTYADASTTYLWISQTGTFTQSTNPNTSISNSALLASVVTAGGQITTVTDLANRRIPGLVIPANYRDGLFISGDSSTTIKVFPGSAEVNNAMVSKTSTTTLTLTTATDWAGGSSLQAINTYGFVGIDASGNIKMHTTEPTHTNYAVSLTAGKKRYATWSSTVYRILGWFFMGAASSGTLSSDTATNGQTYFYEVGNIKEGNVPNSTLKTSRTAVSTTSLNPVVDPQAQVHFYSSGNPVDIRYNTAVAASANDNTGIIIQIDGSNRTDSLRERTGTNVTTRSFNNATEWQEILSQGTHTIQGMYSADANTVYINKRVINVTEK